MIGANMDENQFCDYWLLEQDPDLVLSWFYEIWEGTRQIPQGLNWLYLAETFPNLAYKNDNVSGARVGVVVNTYLIYEIKAHGRVFWSNRLVRPDARERACDTPERRVMGLRVRFLLKHGHIPGDPVLDRDLLVESFFDGLTLSPEEALKQCAAGRNELS